jgi:LPS sulfotransferase NodH
MVKSSKPKLLFIISNARSGSTMLRQLLNTHQSIGIPEREFGELKKVLLNFNSYDDLTNTIEFNKFYREAEGITTLNLGKTTDYKEGVYKISEQEWQQNAESLNLDDLYKYLLEFYVKVSKPSKSNILWVGDKSPQHFHYLSELIGSFPNAKYIFLTRNPIDISLSQDRFSFRHFNQEFGYERVTKAWKNLHKKNNPVLNIRISKNIKRLINTRNIFKEHRVSFYEVSYENLLGDLRQSLSGIANFLEITDMFHINKFQIRKSSSGHKEGVNKILTTNKLKYKNILNSKMIRNLEHKFGDGVKYATNKTFGGSYNYDISKSKVFLYKFKYLLNVILTFVKTLGFKDAMLIIVNRFYFKNYQKKS